MILHNNDIPSRKVDDYASRKILGTGGSLMMVEVRFKKGGIGEVHFHEAHEQTSYIVKGKFEVSVDGVKSILSAGDSFYAGLRVPHGVVALEDSIILDVFTPLRQDFLEAEVGE
ncbi:cupin domain-containing protein [Cohnella thailandensis]|uniref:Cupin domain-containing protein n=1 Tax=Cohnella thailandensis TaxID=557557 RepID=A0A841T1I3_9BACL|nr:cupin domain-containing protein [Cohnella thailandensis]MBB6635940.1 cupin domain-containing protein [Cohnella thailandensis]MBP1976318.1 quercetin dioxygenase-like cupin family protein [Cohnella thailandensis]